jgi:hypothetical protein
MRMAIVMMLSLTAAACATGGQEGGLATYDALQRAQADCAAKGMTLRPRAQGNTKYIDAYACERK